MRRRENDTHEECRTGKRKIKEGRKEKEELNAVRKDGGD
jgi:hypothetical protein